MVGVAVLPAKCSVEPRHPPAEGAPPLALETGESGVAGSVERKHPTGQAGGIRGGEGGVADSVERKVSNRASRWH